MSLNTHLFGKNSNVNLMLSLIIAYYFHLSFAKAFDFNQKSHSTEFNLLENRIDFSNTNRTVFKFRTRLFPASRTKVNHFFPNQENKLKFKRSRYSTSVEDQNQKDQLIRIPNPTEDAVPKLSNVTDHNRRRHFFNEGRSLDLNTSFHHLHPKRANNFNADNENENDDNSKVEVEKREPLTCYQCKSSLNTICDEWVELRRSEKYNLRTACTVDMGTYCFKSVVTQNKRGQSETVRGCYGPGPLKTDRGYTLEILEGCIRHRPTESSYAISCFCLQNLCNSATIPNFSLSFRYLLMVPYFIFLVMTA